MAYWLTVDWEAPDLTANELTSDAVFHPAH